MSGFRITPDGFRSIVAMCLTGEAGEHVVDVREGSLFELAKSVAARCEEICSARDVEMSDEVYVEAVADLAPHMRPRDD